MHFKAIFRRLSGAKSRESNTEMQLNGRKSVIFESALRTVVIQIEDLDRDALTPIMRFGDFRNTL